MHFGSKTLDANVNKQFTVSLVADSASDLAVAPVDLTYDPKILRLDDVASGDLMKQGGVIPIVTRNVQNESGRASVQVARQPGASGASGSGAVLTLTFTAIAAGETQVAAPSIPLRDSQGRAAGTGSAVMTVNVK